MSKVICLWDAKAQLGEGVRYDLIASDDPKVREDNHMDEYTEQLITHHVSGRLKVAPEHTLIRIENTNKRNSWKIMSLRQ